MPVTEGVKQTGPIAAGWEAGHPNVNLPNLLTLSRILLIPVFVLLFWTPTPGRSLAAAVVFVIAAVTDLLDGYLARRRSQVTKLGRLLDPIADKLLVLSGLILLVQLQRVAAVVAILIIAREVAVTGVRAIAASQGIVLSAGRSASTRWSRKWSRSSCSSSKTGSCRRRGISTSWAPSCCMRPWRWRSFQAAGTSSAFGGRWRLRSCSLRAAPGSPSCCLVIGYRPRWLPGATCSAPSRSGWSLPSILAAWTPGPPGVATSGSPTSCGSQERRQGC